MTTIFDPKIEATSHESTGVDRGNLKKGIFQDVEDEIKSAMRRPFFTIDKLCSPLFPDSPLKPLHRIE